MAQKVAPESLIPLAAGGKRYSTSTKSLRNWIAEGRITGYRFGGRIMVDPDELAALAKPIPTLQGLP